MDAITVLKEDHTTIGHLLDAVSGGDVTAVPRACEALRQHARMEQEVLYPALARHLSDPPYLSVALDSHSEIGQLIDRLSGSSHVDASYLSGVADLARRAREHVEAEDQGLLPLIAAEMNEAAREELGEALATFREGTRKQFGGDLGDEAPSADTPVDGAGADDGHTDRGASSDGDRSWAQDPVAVDPEVDRSVEAVIRRTGGR